MESVQLCVKGKWGEFPKRDWFFEKKLDGTRCLVGKASSKVVLINRRREEYTRKFPEIVADLKGFPHDFIMDGEICAKDFTALAGRAHLEDEFKIKLRMKLEPCTYFAFDLLVLDGQDLKRLPLATRKEKLYSLGETEHVKFVRPEPLEELLKKVEAHEIEGIVAKDPNSPYVPKRDPSWMKYRKETVEDLEIIGYEDTDKPRRPYRSLILKRGNGEIQASSGLSEADLRLTDEIFKRAKVARVVGTKRYFERPVGICEVEFYGGSEIPVRFPRVRRLRFDK